MKTLTNILLLAAILCGCNSPKANNQDKKIDNNYAFDTTFYYLPENTTNVIYQDLSSSEWSNANFCLILFTDSTMSLLFNYRDRNTEVLLAGDVSTNRVMKIKNKTFPVYFMSDYAFANPQNTTPYTPSIHEAVKSYKVDYGGNLVIK